MGEPRRGYSPSNYVPSGYDDERRTRTDDRYADQGAVDSYSYGRGTSTYDRGSDRQAGALSRDPYYNRDYADDDYYDRRYDEDDKRSTRSRSRRRSKSKGRDSSRKSGDRYSRDESEEREERTIKGHFGKERKDLAATAIGVVAGAFLGHEAGKKHGPAATIGGALLGGLAANAIEHQHLKRQQEKRLEKKNAYENDYDDDGYYERR